MPALFLEQAVRNENGRSETKRQSINEKQNNPDKPALDIFIFHYYK